MSKASDSALIQELRDRLDRLEGRLPAEPAAQAQPGAFKKFPITVYKDLDGDGIVSPDHPGNESKIVGSGLDLDADEAALAEAIEDGWSLSHKVPKPAKGKKGQPAAVAAPAAPAALSRAAQRKADKAAKADKKGAAK